MSKKKENPKYWLVLIVKGENDSITENMLYSSNNLEAMSSVISFYSSRVSDKIHLEVWEAITFDPFDTPDEYKIIKEVRK